MKKTIKVGYVGLGRRGCGIIEAVLRYMSDVEIAAICDLVPEKMNRATELLAAVGKPKPKFYTDYRELVKDPDLDAVFVMTGWNAHVEISLASLRAGKYTAVEVGTAYDLQDCFDLVAASEATGAQLMLLENCCYGRREMAALRAIKEGLFGEIVHAEGGYHHYLPTAELFMKKPDGTIDTDHYRLTEYLSRNSEQYPTHEIGPISKALSVNRGNRMESITAVASKAVGLSDYMARKVPSDHPFTGKTFAQGDIVDAVITCAGGETIHIQLDTTLPRPFYSRAFEIRGTKGGMCEHSGDHATWWAEDITGDNENLFDNEQEFLEKLDHPLHKEYRSNEIKNTKGQHPGGIDWLVCRAFIESVKAGTQTPINVYDAATWMAIGPLSEMSIRKGGAPVDFPDFTRGKWIRPNPPFEGKYSLDIIIEDKTTPIFRPGETEKL